MKNRAARRKFLEQSLKIGIGIPFLSSPLIRHFGQSSKKLDILILGGTSFLGPHQVAYAISRGHRVTTFTRGKTKPTIYRDLFDHVEMLIGDRQDNLTALKNRKWDAVIDNSGRDPEWTMRTAKLLQENCELYLYTSSTGVFYPYLKDEYFESDQVLLTLPPDIDEEDKFIYDYGIMKANSELEARKYFGDDRTIVVRPTYMFGPADRTDRFIHWPLRLKKGGEVMIPGHANDPVQYIDVRDVAEWMIRLIEQKKSGIYNAVGPAEATGITSFVEQAQKAFDVPTTYVQINNYEFLKENDVHYIVPWIMPVGNNMGSALANNQKAIANGLTFRPLHESIKETYDWWNSDAVAKERREKYASDENSIMSREKDIIRKWKSR